MKSTRQNNNEFYGNVILGDDILDTHSVTGSLGISGSLQVISTIRTTNTTNATTWTNGALIVDGGVGIGKDVWISGSLNVLGSTNIINVSSSQLIIEDNIITVNGYSPYLRYAGIEAIDSGSGITSSLLWDGQNDYWLMISSSNQTSRLLGTTFGAFGSETSLTSGYIPRATSGNTIANSVIFESSSNIGIGQTSPTYALDITKSGVTTQLRVSSGVGSTNYTGGIRLGAYDATQTADILFTAAGENSLTITTNYVSNSNAIYLKPGGATGLTVLGNSNVGINTTTPNSKLEVLGSAVNSGSSDILTVNTNSITTGYYGSITFRQSSTNIGARITSGNNDSYKGFLSFETSQQTAAGSTTVEAMRIDGAGNIGIGTTSPTYKLDILHPDAGLARFQRDLATDTGLIIEADASGPILRSTGAHIFRFYNASSELVRIDGSSGNVGIGTITPSASLHVYASSTSVGRFDSSGWATVQLGAQANATGTKNYQITARNDAFYIARSTDDWVSTGTYLLHINSSSNVAIGSTNASYKLDVTGDIRSTANAYFATTSGNVGIGTTSPGAKLHIYDANTNAVLKIESDGSDDSSDILIDRPNNVRRSDVQFTTADVIDWVIGTLYNGGAANSKFSISTTRDLADSKVTVDTTGFIGLGTTSPTSLLHVEGGAIYTHKTTTGATANFHNDQENQVFLKAGNSNDIRLIFEDAGTRAEIISLTGTVHDLVFKTYGSALTEKMRITGDGNIGVGITAPTSKLHVSASSTDTGVLNIQNSSGTNIMYVSSSGDIGIANSIPKVKLHINGSPALNATSTQTLIRLERPYNSGVSWAQGVDLALGRGISYPSSQLRFLLDNGTNNPTNPQAMIMSLDSSGKVGINTTAPSYNLEILGSDGFRITSGSGAGGINIIPYKTGHTYHEIKSDGGNEDIVISPGSTERVRFVQSTGYVGIGTSSPSQILHLERDNADVGIAFTETGGSVWHVGMDYSNSNVLSIGNSSTIGTNPVMTLNTNGNVGIGTIDPQNTLSLRSATPTFNIEASNFTHNFASSIYSRPNSVGAWSYYSGTKGGSLFSGIGKTEIPGLSFFGASDETAPTVSPVQFISLKRSSNTTAALGSAEKAFSFLNGAASWASGTELVTILGGGNLGVGNNAPSQKLDVSGNIRGGTYHSTNTTDGWLLKQESGTNRGLYYYTSSNSWHFFNNGSTVANITTGGSLSLNGTLSVNGTSNSYVMGNFGIGTTSPGHRLHINQSGANTTSNIIVMTHANIANSNLWIGTYASDETVSAFRSNNVFESYAPIVFSAALSGNYISFGTDRTGATFTETMRITGGKVGIGTSNPQSILDVSGPIRIYDTTRARYINMSPSNNNQEIQTSGGNLNLVPAGGTVLIYKTSVDTNLVLRNAANADAIALYSNGNSHINGGNLGIGTTTPTSKLHVSGSTTIQGSGSSLLTVQGSTGQLFNITDSLSGSLFSVNDISGLPILEVFSDGNTIIGDYQAPSLYTTKKVVNVVGNNVICSVPTASYDGAWFEYVIKSGSNARMGQVASVWAGSSTSYTETTTTDLGNTTGVKFMTMISGSNMILTGSFTTANWTVKTIVRAI